MPSSKSDKIGSEHGRKRKESRDITQLGLDFMSSSGYSVLSRKEDESMNHELFESLDNKIASLLEKYTALKDENARLLEENQRFQAEREGIRLRVDAILGKLEGI